MGLGEGDGSAPAGAPAVPSVGGWTWRAAATVPPPAFWAEGKDAELEGAREREKGGEVGAHREARGSEDGWEARRKERSGCGRGCAEGWRKPLVQMWGRTRQCPAFNLGSGGGEKS